LTRGCASHVGGRRARTDVLAWLVVEPPRRSKNTRMAQTGSSGQPQQGSGQSRFWVPALIAVVTFIVTAAVTYSQDLLTPAGNALAAGAAAVLTGSLANLFFPSTSRGIWSLISLGAAVCLVFSLMQLRDEAPRGVASFVGGCDPFDVYAQNRWDALGAAVRAAPLPTAKQGRRIRRQRVDLR
jgi:hypothetical protein